MLNRVAEGERLEATLAQYELKRPSRPLTQKRTRPTPTPSRPPSSGRS